MIEERSVLIFCKTNIHFRTSHFKQQHLNEIKKQKHLSFHKIGLLKLVTQEVQYNVHIYVLKCRQLNLGFAKEFQYFFHLFPLTIQFVGGNYEDVHTLKEAFC